MSMCHQRPSTQELLCSAFMYCIAALTHRPKKKKLWVTKSRLLIVTIKIDVFVQLDKTTHQFFATKKEKSHLLCLFYPQSKAKSTERVFIAPYLYNLDFISNDEAKIKTLPSFYSGSILTSIVKHISQYCQNTRF